MSCGCGIGSSVFPQNICALFIGCEYVHIDYLCIIRSIEVFSVIRRHCHLAHCNPQFPQYEAKNEKEKKNSKKLMASRYFTLMYNLVFCYADQIVVFIYIDPFPAAISRVYTYNIQLQTLYQIHINTSVRSLHCIKIHYALYSTVQYSTSEQFFVDLSYRLSFHFPAVHLLTSK